MPLTSDARLATIYAAADEGALRIVECSRPDGSRAEILAAELTDEGGKRLFLLALILKGEDTENLTIH